MLYRASEYPDLIYVQSVAYADISDYVPSRAIAYGLAYEFRQCV